ncbi:thioredoxin family protein [Candidatus Babeliales bacterium]|nr:thioredoxin family protein [Candidatus Babeliales bacterium]
MNKKVFMIVVLFGSIVFAENAQTQHEEKASCVQVITADQLPDILKNVDKPVLVKIAATWCPPCQKIKPWYEMVAQQYQDNVIFVEMDFDSNKAWRIERNIYAVPYFILYVKNAEVAKSEGCPLEQAEFELFLKDGLEFALTL